MCAPVILNDENYKTAWTHIGPAVPKFSIRKCQRLHHYYYKKAMWEVYQNYQAPEGRDIKIIPKSVYKKLVSGAVGDKANLTILRQILHAHQKKLLSYRTFAWDAKNKRSIALYTYKILAWNATIYIHPFLNKNEHEGYSRNCTRRWTHRNDSMVATKRQTIDGSQTTRWFNGERKTSPAQRAYLRAVKNKITYLFTLFFCTLFFFITFCLLMRIVAWFYIPLGPSISAKVLLQDFIYTRFMPRWWKKSHETCQQVSVEYHNRK